MSKKYFHELKKISHVFIFVVMHFQLIEVQFEITSFRDYTMFTGQ